MYIYICIDVDVDVDVHDVEKINRNGNVLYQIYSIS